MSRLFLFIILSLIIHGMLLFGFNSDSLFIRSETNTSSIGRVLINIVPQRVSKIKSSVKTKSQAKERKEKDQRFNQGTADRELTQSKSDYLLYLKKKVYEFKQYPFVAKKMKIQGITEVELSIGADGAIAFKLIKSSGNQVLDIASLDIFNKIGKLKKLPKNIDAINIIIPIQYILEQEYK